MNVKINAYKRKDATYMLYVNCYERKVSLPVGEVIYTTKLSAGQMKLLEARTKILDQLEALDIIPVWENHNEPKAKTAWGDLYITDVGSVGGQSVGTDGAFLYVEGRGLFDLSQSAEVDY